MVDGGITLDPTDRPRRHAPSRYARNCWPCRRYAHGISPTCARSRRTGSTGARSGRWHSKYRALIATAVHTDTKKLYTSDAFEATSGSGDESVKAFADGRRAFLLGEK